VTISVSPPIPADSARGNCIHECPIITSGTSRHLSGPGAADISSPRRPMFCLTTGFSIPTARSRWGGDLVTGAAFSLWNEGKRPTTSVALPQTLFFANPRRVLCQSGRRLVRILGRFRKYCTIRSEIFEGPVSLDFGGRCRYRLWRRRPDKPGSLGAKRSQKIQKTAFLTPVSAILHIFGNDLSSGYRKQLFGITPIEKRTVLLAAEVSE